MAFVSLVYSSYVAAAPLQCFANLSDFRTFVRFVLVWICRFPLPLGVWEGLRFVIVALPGLFSYLFFWCCSTVFAIFRANHNDICALCVWIYLDLFGCCTMLCY